MTIALYSSNLTNLLKSRKRDLERKEVLLHVSEPRYNEIVRALATVENPRYPLVRNNDSNVPFMPWYIDMQQTFFSSDAGILMLQ
jgi:hypothetical protein